MLRAEGRLLGFEAAVANEVTRVSQGQRNHLVGEFEMPYMIPEV